MLRLKYLTGIWFFVAVAPFSLPRKENGYIYEDDMILSKGEIDNIWNHKDVRGADKVATRNYKDGPVAAAITANPENKWFNGAVPYVINSKLRCVGESFFKKAFCFLEGATDAIEDAIKEFEKHTCIRFKKRTNERDYVEFIDDGLGKCYANVGRIGGRQVIALGRFCRKQGTAIHEMMHTIGFFHEQSRPDRDDHVTILWNNIKKGSKINFKKYFHGEVYDLGEPYDISSIMHYENNAFAKWPWLKTIAPKTKSQHMMGQRKTFSRGDIKEINKYYKC